MAKVKVTVKQTTFGDYGLATAGQEIEVDERRVEKMLEKGLIEDPNAKKVPAKKLTK